MTDQKELETAARESFNDFQNASFPKFARENYPELACANMDRFSYEKGFLAGHAYAHEKESEGFEEWFAKLGDSYLSRVIKLNRGASKEAWQAARLSAEKEIASLKDKLESLRSRDKIRQEIIKQQDEKITEATSVLEWICNTDRSTNPPDIFWLQEWRHTRKEAAKKALEKIKER